MSAVSATGSGLFLYIFGLQVVTLGGIFAKLVLLSLISKLNLFE